MKVLCNSIRKNKSSQPFLHKTNKHKPRKPTGPPAVPDTLAPSRPLTGTHHVRMARTHRQRLQKERLLPAMTTSRFGF